MLFQCILQGGHVSHYHERMSRHGLACQHFISNSIFFVNLVTIFCFSMRMPIDTCSNIYLRKSQKLFSFHIKGGKTLFILSCFASIATPAFLTWFALSPLLETSTKRARKYNITQENQYVPKITLEGLRYVWELYGGFVLWALSSLDLTRCQLFAF